MLAALALVLPLGLASAVGPLMLSEQMVLLASPAGRRAALGYALGVVFATIALVVAIVILGRAISLPAEPQLDAQLDLTVGGALLAAGIAVAALVRRRPARAARPDRARTFGAGAGGVVAAFAFGIAAMATNLTGLPWIASAAKEISASGTGVAGRILLGVILIALGSAPAWVPLVLTRIAPRAGERFLEGLSASMRRYGLAAVATLLGGAGAFFLVRGLLGLLG